MVQASLGEVTVWTITHWAHPWSINEERNWHYQHRARQVAEWRRAWAVLAKAAHVAPCSRIAVIVTPLGVRQDTANCLPAAKAAIDGLVDAQVVPRDTGEYVVAITFKAPRAASRHGLELVVRGEHL